MKTIVRTTSEHLGFVALVPQLAIFVLNNMAWRFGQLC
jgi:hypothetical protein